MGIFDFLRSQPKPAGAVSNTPDGQAPSSIYRARAVGERQMDELIGICRGVLVDGAVSEMEAHYLLKWLETNQSTAHIWPASALYARLQRALADDVLDKEEERDLIGLLQNMVGAPQGTDVPIERSSTLPLDRPAPEVTFEGQAFCFTGQFACGSRQWCEQQVAVRGGIAKANVNKTIRYLVIGEIGSRDWMHSTHGRKIEAAMALKEKGHKLFIIGEQHWHRATTR